MHEFYYTFRSITAAQRGQTALEAAGIPVRLRRTPAPLSVNGCGYCLCVSARWADAAAHTLRTLGVQRCHVRTEAGFTEVDRDLL